MRTKTLNQLLSTTYSDIQFLVQPELLPAAGTMAIYGKAGTLKSWLVIDMMFALATGKVWLAYPCAEVPVLMVQGEQTEAQYQPRIVKYCEELNGAVPKNLLFDNDITLKLDGFIGLKLLESSLQEWKAQKLPHMPKVIVLDCLYQLLSGSVSSETDLKQFTGTVDKIRDDYGCAFVIVHHPRKAGEGDLGLEEMLSSSILGNWLDTIIKVESHPPDADQPSTVDLRFQKIKHASQEISGIRVKFNKHSVRFSPA